MGVMGEVIRAAGRVSGSSDLPYTGAVKFNSLVRHLLVGGSDPMMALASAEADLTCPRDVIVALKSAVSGGSLNDPNWSALGGSRQIVAGYIEALASVSFFDRAWTDNAFVRVQERTPVVVVTQGSTASTVAEGAPTPVSSMTLAAPSVVLRKSISEVIITNEVARNPFNTGFIGLQLKLDVAKQVDTAAIAIIIAAGATGATSGGTVANLTTDLKTALTAIEVGVQSRLYWVLTPTLAVSLAARVAASTGNWDLGPSGGTLAGIPVVVSAGVPAGDLVLVDASRFAGFNDALTLLASNEATIQMNTAPDSPPTSATTLTSLFQANLTSLKAVRYWGLQNLTTTASATITGMT
jgi:hypothetical protein